MRQFFNPYPKYLQIRQMILRQIQQNSHVGERLPTEHDFCKQFGVSRDTVRAALLALEEEGIILRTPGRGTFVRRLPQKEVTSRLTGLTEDFNDLKLDTESRVLEAVELRATPEIAALMGLKADEPICRITRVRMFEGQPLAYSEAILPLDIGRRMASLDLRKSSMYRELKHTLKIPLWEDHQIVDAVIADPAAAELLSVPIGAPLLALSRLYFTTGRKPVVLFRALYRSDRYYYTIKLTRPESQDVAPRRPANSPRPVASRAQKPEVARK